MKVAHGRTDRGACAPLQSPPVTDECESNSVSAAAPASPVTPGNRGEAEATIAVARDLFGEIDLPGEVFAHMALALGRPVAGRRRGSVWLVSEGHAPTLSTAFGGPGPVDCGPVSPSISPAPV